MQAKYVALEYFLYFLFFSRAKSCCLIHAVWGTCQNVSEMFEGYQHVLSRLIPYSDSHRHGELEGVSSTIWAKASFSRGRN